MCKRHLARNILPLLLVAVLAACSSPEQKYERHIERAKVRYEEQDFAAARIELLNAIKAKPSSSEAYHLMARTLVALQAYQEALGAYENAVELAPGNRSILLDYVNFLIAGKGYDRALALLQQALEKGPQDAGLRRQMIRTLASAGWTAEAIEAARRLTQDQPDSPENWLSLVQAFLAASDADGAREALERARETAPKDDPAVAMAEVELLLYSGDISAAGERLKTLSEIYPENIAFGLRKAQVLEGMGDLDGAIAAYEKVLEQEVNPSLRSQLGLLLMKKGKTGEAVAHWEKALEKNPYASEPRLHIARARLGEGEEEEASKLLGEVLTASPENREALALRGIISLKSGRFREAASDLEKAVAGEVQNPPWHMALGDASLGAGNLPRARQAFEKVLETDPDNARAHLALAGILAKEGRLEESDSHAEMAARTQGMAAPALDILGGNALASGKGKEAVSLFEKALQSAPGNPRLRMKLAAALNFAGEKERSIEILRDLVADRPNDLFPLSSYVGILSRAGRLPEAVEAARKHYRKDSPGHGILLAETLARAGRSSEAEAAFRAVVEDHPDYGQGYYRMAAFYSREGRLDDARAWLEKSLERKKENRYGLIFLLGVLQEADGDPKAAQASYRAALKENPEFVPALNNLAWSLAQEGNLEEALKISTNAREIDPEDPNLGDTHGWILFRSGDPEGALPLLRQAREALPENRDVGLHLVEVLEAVGRTEEASRLRRELEGN